MSGWPHAGPSWDLPSLRPGSTCSTASSCLLSDLAVGYSPPHSIGEGERVRWRIIGPPRHVSVGPYQHEPALVEGADLGIGHRHDRQRHPTPGKSLLDR